MKSVTRVFQVFLFLGWYSSAQSEPCSRPEVTRERVHIYRHIERAEVEVYSCMYRENRIIYNDITESCLRAARKDTPTRNRNDRSYLIVIKDSAEVDVQANQIRLKSGTICKYNRGFCYDPLETNHYAAVWNVTLHNQDLKKENLEEIFFGYVDMWKFANKNLTFIFYLQERNGKAFSLQLTNKSTFGHTSFWHTAENNFIVSQLPLTSKINFKQTLNETHLLFEPNNLVSETVLKTCDTESYPLDFENEIDLSYISDPKPLKTILATLQTRLLDIHSSPLAEKQNSSVQSKLYTIENKLKNTDSSFAKHDNHIINIKKDLSLTKQILSKHTGILDEFKDRVVSLSKINAKQDFIEINKALAELRRELELEHEEVSKLGQTLNNASNILQEYSTAQINYSQLVNKMNDHELKIENFINLYPKSLHEALEKVRSEMEYFSRSSREAVLKNKNVVLDMKNELLNLQKTIEKKGEQLSMGLKKHEAEIQTTREQSEKCEETTASIAAENKNKFEVIQQKVTNVYLALLKKETENSKLEDDLRNTQDSLKALIKQYTDSMIYINSSLKKKDEEIAEMHSLLQKKDYEIEHIAKVHNEDLEKLLAAQEEIELITKKHNEELAKLLADQDKMANNIKRIQNELVLPPAN